MTKTPSGLTGAKAMFLYDSVDQGRRLEYRKWLDTAVVPAVNDADIVWRMLRKGEILVFGLWG